MGQVLQRAMNRVPKPSRSRPSAPQSMSRNPEEISTPTPDAAVPVQDLPGVSSPEDISKTTVENSSLEERDPGYDVLLQKMIGTIRTRPGGKQEMGEAIIIQKFKRPLPKVRSSKDESVSHGQKPVPPGTLTIAQVQEIMLLHQGKSVDHGGPMDIHTIAHKFGVDPVQVEKIIQFVSLPSEQQEKGTK